MQNLFDVVFELPVVQIEFGIDGVDLLGLLNELLVGVGQKQVFFFELPDCILAERLV